MDIVQDVDTRLKLAGIIKTEATVKMRRKIFLGHRLKLAGIIKTEAQTNRQKT